MSNNLALFVRELDKQEHGPGWKKFLQTEELARVSKTKVDQLTAENHETLKILDRRFKMVQQKPEYVRVMRLRGFQGTAKELDQKLALAERHADVVASVKAKPKNAKPNFLQSPVIANAFTAQAVIEPERVEIQPATPAKSEPKSESQPAKQDSEGLDELDLIATKPESVGQPSQVKHTSLEKKLVDVKLSLKPRSADKLEATQVKKENLLKLDLKPLETLDALPELEPVPQRVRLHLDPKQDEVAKALEDLTVQKRREKLEPVLEAENPLPALDQLPAPAELPERIAAPIVEEPNEDVTQNGRQKWQDLFSSVYSYLARR